MKTTVKQKLLLSLVAGLSFAVLSGLFDFYILEKPFSWPLFIIHFVAFGLLFGYGFVIFIGRLSDHLLNKIDIELLPEEKVKQEGPANLFKGIEGVGGKLVLTNQRLIFKSHKINLQRGLTELQLDSITEVKPVKLSKLVKNGLKVLCTTGEQYLFVVHDRDFWLSSLKNRQPLNH